MNHQYFKQVDLPGQSKVNNKVFPIAYSPVSQNSFIFLQEYFEHNREEIIKEISEKGAVYFRGFDVRSPNELASVINKLGLDSFEYVGGAAVRKLVVGTEGRKVKSVEVFTTNEAPPHEPIPFHNELLQNSNYPEYIAFYCYSEAEKGGSTPLANGEDLYKYIQNKYPEFLQKLEEIGVRYTRIVGKEDNPNSPIGRGWKNIFKCDTKEEVNNQLEARGYECEWFEEGHGDADDCRLTSKVLPAITVSKSGKKVFCNQLIAVSQGWIDNKNQPKDCLKFGDHSQIPFDILEDIAEYADKIKSQIEWQEGDFVLIDNQMAMHARQPYIGHNRKIYAVLLKGHKPITPGLNLTLNSGDLMPLIGFGTWKLDKQICEEIIYNAIKNGYRLIDCAGLYGNEVEVGRGINRALSEGFVKREDLFITSKLWNTFHRPEHVKLACQRTLKDLNLSYLDLYLIHQPLPLKYVDPSLAYPTIFYHEPIGPNGPEILHDNVPIIDTWHAMEVLIAEGMVRNIGVSNFSIALLRDLTNSILTSKNGIKPAVNQIEIHPYNTQEKAIKFNRRNCVQLTSYSTLGPLSYLQLSLSSKEELLTENPIILTLSKKYNKTPVQIILKWAVQQGLAIIPKTSKMERLQENSEMKGWWLEEGEIREIGGLGKEGKGRGYCVPEGFVGGEEGVKLILY